MPTTVKVTTIGSSAGIVLPREVLSKLNVQKGDSLYLTETPEGFKLTPYNDQFDATVKVAQDVMRRYRDTLKKLAE
ncbi:AbrB/MazE/SpoVT family DNA-binding domain-containing protein [Silvibacterium acidisoli]|uniref:AbrB/MazE/SpoVT family DNA-binding domain-containing protein n=1 Tax=Acidobacteriaceae bacterium ZG23-2 TaxID=2883246 RepID=UPI00406C7D0F